MTTAIETLKQYPLWTGCKYPDKIPLNPHTGGNAQSDNPKTFGTYEQAEAAKTRYGWTHTGVAFVPDVVEIMGIDIDKCVADNGQIEPWAMEIIRRIDSYVEFSPSGKGVHILCYGALPKTIGANDAPETCEMYDRLRWFTITGNHFPGTPATIESRYRQVLDLHADVLQRIEQYKRAKQQKTKPVTAAANRQSTYGQAAFTDELATLAATGEGARNTQLFKSTANLRELANAGALDWPTVEESLHNTALAIGLDEREVIRTIESAKKRVNGTVREIPTLNDLRIVSSQIEQEKPQPPDRVEVINRYLLTESLDDEGNAQCLLKRYPDKFLYSKTIGWLTYNGSHWTTSQAEEKLDRDIVRILKLRRFAAVEAEKDTFLKSAKLKSNASTIAGCKYNLKSLVNANILAFDADPDLLNCKNGVIDLKTGALISHSPTQLFTYCIETEYHPKTSYKLWEDWLLSVLVPEGQEPTNQHLEVLNWLQMAVGYTLTGRTNEQCLFYLQGPTRAGKGILQQTLLKLMGKPLGASVDFDTFTAKRKADNQNFDLAPLRPARLVTASESERDNMLSAKRVKAITGNDPVYCAHKGRDFFSYTPLYKIWFASNFKIMADADDDALWGRLRVIHFPNSFLGREDFTLGQRLQSEENLQAVLSWAIQGSKRWYKRLKNNTGLGRPELINSATADHRIDNDTVAQWIEDRVQLAPNEITPVADIKEDYEKWCNENGRKPLGARRFNTSLERRGCSRKQEWMHGRNKKAWRGIGLMN